MTTKQKEQVKKDVKEVKKTEQKVEQKPIIQEVKKIVPIKGTDIEKTYLELMFTRDKIDKKLDKQKEELIKEFVDEYNNPKICATIVDPKFRMRTIFTNLFRRYQPIIKSNAIVGTAFFSSKFSDKEARDTNENKRNNDPTLKENWVLNTFGCLFDKINGALTPFNATIWGDTAVSDIPKDRFVKILYVPSNRGDDDEKYRSLTIRKIIGNDKLIYQNKEVKVPEDISKYVPRIPAQEIENYVGKIVTTTGRVITFNDKVTGKGNYTLSISSADPIEVSMDDMVTVLAIGKIKPIWEQDSQVAITGKVFAPREEKEEIIDDTFEVVGGAVAEGGEPLPDEPEEPKGKMFNIFASKIEPIGEEGKDWVKAKSNEISASGSFEEYSETDFDKDISPEGKVVDSDEPEVVTNEAEETFNIDE